MIYRERGCLVAECTDCGTTTEGLIDGERDWDQFLRDLRGAGWRVSKDDVSGEWEHRCDECSGG